jgi:hypothetical protein
MDDEKKESERPSNKMVDEEEHAASVHASQVAAASFVLDTDSDSGSSGSFYEGEKPPLKTEDIWAKRDPSDSAAENLAGEERDKRLTSRRNRRDAKNSNTASKGNRSMKLSPTRRDAMNSDPPSKGAWMGSNRRINSSPNHTTTEEALKPAKLTLATANKDDSVRSFRRVLTPVDEKKKGGKANWRGDDYALGLEENAEPGAVRIGSSDFSELPELESNPSYPISPRPSTDGEVVNAAIVDEESLQREFEVKMRVDMVQAAEVDFYEEPGFCQRNAGKIGCASIVIIVGLAVGLGVGWSNSSGTAVVQNITDITNAPTPSPTPLGDYEYLEFLFRTISGDELVDETTPQAQALESIYNESQSGVYNVRDLSEHYLEERYALRVLYYSTQGDGWGIADNNFTSTLPTCSWMNATQGNRLVCNEQEEVTDLFLNVVNLNGTIPSELGVLSSLAELSLAKNELYGKSVCTGTCAGSELIESKPS